jgi:hypothetical protein
MAGSSNSICASCSSRPSAIMLPNSSLPNCALPNEAKGISSAPGTLRPRSVTTLRPWMRRWPLSASFSMMSASSTTGFAIGSSSKMTKASDMEPRTLES